MLDLFWITFLTGIFGTAALVLTMLFKKGHRLTALGILVLYAALVPLGTAAVYSGGALFVLLAAPFIAVATLALLVYKLLSKKTARPTDQQEPRP